MWNLIQDIRYGVRMLAKSPVVTLVAALSLALGIAANTITFSVVNGFLFEPYPYENQDRLAIVWEVNRVDSDDSTVAFANYLDFRDRSKVFEELVAYRSSAANLTGGEQPKQIRSAAITGSTFQTLGRTPILGRGFRAEEARADASVVILDYAFWQTHFAGAGDVLGEEIVLDGEPLSVIGVMPEDFDLLPANIDVYRPTELVRQSEDRESRELVVIGRLASGRTREQADAEMKAIAAQLEREYPETNEGYSARVVSLRDVFPGPTDSRLVIVLSVVALFVLLIACANVANLLLARAEVRQSEVALRTALGAARGRILRQLLTESILLSVLGGSLGTIFSFYSIPALATTMPAELPVAFLPRLNAHVLIYTVLVSVFAGLCFGAAPAVHSFSKDLRASLGDSARSGGASKSRHRWRNGFAMTQIAASLALLLGGGSLVRIFDRLVNADHGFDVNGVVTAQLRLSEDQYADDSELIRFYREALESLRKIPGVSGVAAMTTLPRSRGTSSTQFFLEGQETSPRSEHPTTVYQTVNSEYFDALGVAIVQGRAFTESDHEESRRVAVVSRTLTDRFFAGEDPLGKRIVVFEETREIVGVSADVFQPRMPEQGGALPPIVYLPWAQKPDRSLSIALRASGEPSRLSADVRESIYAVRPDQSVGSVQTLRDHIDIELSGPKVISMVLSLFGVIALILSAMGVYGVMAHTVGQRSREIGIRMAMGASGANVVRLVTGEGVRLTVSGLVLGAPAAWLLIRGIRATFEGFPGLPAGLMMGVVSLLLGVSLLAAYLPARRAANIEPTEALNM